MHESKAFILDPTGIRQSVVMQPAPRPDDLAGLTVGLFECGTWRSFGVVLDRYVALLKEHYGVGNVIRVNVLKAGAEAAISREDLVKEMATKCNVVILGLGRGSNTVKLVLDGIELEGRGIPTVTFVTDWFLSMAETVCKGAGLPNPGLVVVPHAIDGLPEVEVIEIADHVLADAVAKITVNNSLSAQASKF